MDQNICIASPSLALIKYWGKKRMPGNLTATPSLAVTLGGLETETQVYPGPEDFVLLNGKVQEAERYRGFFEHLRRRLKVDQHFHVRTQNNFPSSAGLASSSSGFAALTCAAARAVDRALSPQALSATAYSGGGGHRAAQTHLLPGGDDGDPSDLSLLSLLDSIVPKVDTPSCIRTQSQRYRGARCCGAAQLQPDACRSPGIGSTIDLLDRTYPHRA